MGVYHGTQDGYLGMYVNAVAKACYMKSENIECAIVVGRCSFCHVTLLSDSNYHYY